MKAYKRQKIAMFALIATMGMTGLSNTTFASTVYPTDIGNKQVLPRMQKDSILDLKQNNKLDLTKKHLKRKIKKTKEVISSDVSVLGKKITNKDSIRKTKKNINN